MIVSNQPEVETLAIRTLGGVTIELWRLPMTAAPTRHADQQRVQLRTRTMEALLIYLACQGRPLSRDVLAELLWPNRSQEQARSNLRVAIHRLRQQLEPYFSVTRQQIALNSEAPVALDAVQFEGQLAAGELLAATALYSGDFLEGFYLDDSPAFEQWVLVERERLHTLALAAYQQLIGQQVAAGQFDAAIDSAHHLLHLDPLHEPTHRQLMRLLAQVDQRSAALAQYEICRHLLDSELDAPPDAATTALYEQIRAGVLDKLASTQDDKRIAAPAPSVFSSFAQIETPVRVSSAPNNLPLQPTALIGRSAELAQIDQLLANSDCRLLTLLGVGGIGKTRLAIEAAARRTGTFADGVCFVSLAGVGVADLVATAIAQSLGLQSIGGDPHKEVAAYLRPRTLLLILDNFEHLLAAADYVAQLLQQAAHIKVLVTSRERLNLREEWLFPVAGLSLAEGVAGEAGQLFVRSAQRVQPGFSGRGQEAAIAGICRQVEGMPLALELAASWVRVMPCAEISRQVAQSSQIFTTTLRNLPERHRSMTSLFDHSWRLLSPLEQGVLRRVSVFRGGWRLQEAEQVAGATLAVLLGLVDKSLVRTDGQGRFDLHELVRQYAAAQLVASGEQDLIRQHHCAVYLQFFRMGDSHLRGPQATTWFARLEPEQDNLRAALQWTLDGECYADMAWLLLAAWWFWYHIGRWHELSRWLAQLLHQREVLAANVRLATLIAIWAVVRASDESWPVDRYIAEMLGLLEVCPEQILHSAFWYFTAVHTIDLAQAIAAWERSIACGRAAYDEPGLGPEFGVASDRDYILCNHLWAYAIRLIEHGAFAKATPLLEESARLSQAMGSRYETAMILGIAGRLALLLGDMEKAHALLREAVTLGREFNYHDLLGKIQPYLGLVTLYEGDAPEARRLLDDSLRLCLNLKDKTYLARVCTYLAETALREGELDEAERWLARSLGYDNNLYWSRMIQVERLLVAARLAAAQQQHRRAATLFGLAEQLRSQLHYELTVPVRAQVDAALVAVQAALDAEALADAFAAGQRLSLEEAFATILAPDQLTMTTAPNI